MSSSPYDEVFLNALLVVLKHEGKYVDDKDDPGGATNYGISLRFLQNLPDEVGDLNHDGIIDKLDVQGLTAEEVAELYYDYFWLKASCENINNAVLASKLFDMAVNMGVSQACKLLQSACNLLNPLHPISQDGKIGPVSIATINAYPDQTKLYQTLLENGELFYRNLAAKIPTDAKYLNGWLNRLYDTGVN